MPSKNCTGFLAHVNILTISYVVFTADNRKVLRKDLKLGMSQVSTTSLAPKVHAFFDRAI